MLAFKTFRLAQSKKEPAARSTCSICSRHFYCYRSPRRKRACHGAIRKTIIAITWCK